LTPGPDVIYITTRGIAQGRTAALLSTVGICIGYLVYTMLAALGLSALLQSSAITSRGRSSFQLTVRSLRMN